MECTNFPETWFIYGVILSHWDLVGVSLNAMLDNRRCGCRRIYEKELNMVVMNRSEVTLLLINEIIISNEIISLKLSYTLYSSFFLPLDQGLGLA